MKNGFTLVELLAVIVILSVLGLVATISTSKVIKNTRGDLSEVQIKALEQASQMYVMQEDMAFVNDDRKENRTCVNINYLTKNGYLNSSEVKDINTDEVIKGSIKIKYEANNFSYEYQETECSNFDSGYICEPVKNATFGTKPTGTFRSGDEYICEVKEGTSYKFYVLSTTSDKVNLIMERNVASNGGLAGESSGRIEWVSYYDYRGSDYGSYGKNSEGPITAMNFLHNATKNWTNIENIVVHYDDENTTYGYGGIYTDNNITSITKKDGTVTATYENLKARMASSSELLNVGCLNYNSLEENDGSCPRWVVDYIVYNANYCPQNYSKNQLTGIYGYWLLTSNSANEITALTTYCSDLLKPNRVDISANYGVRPVISVSKELIK